jgi:heme O synthase-like polyprenyltransferase
MVNANNSAENLEIKEKRAWSVFKFSLIYLALFFVAMVVDSTLV